jgi:hypothetical protein
MTPPTFKATAYVKDGCPFSFKFLVFAAESGLLDQIEIVRVREDDPSAAATKQRLSEKLGKPVSFPTVEIEPGRYMTESDELIEHYARRADGEVGNLPVLAFYKQTIFPQLREHHKLTSGRKT